MDLPELRSRAARTAPSAASRSIPSVKDGNDITAGPTGISMDSGTLSTGRVIEDNVVTVQGG